jgi:hypothetical protein
MDVKEIGFRMCGLSELVLSGMQRQDVVNTVVNEESVFGRHPAKLRAVVREGSFFMLRTNADRHSSVG